jgi:hypothetical protein
MTSTNQKLTKMLLYSLEGVGAVFIAIFLAAYLGGLPTTKVLQDEPAFRIPLQIFGAVLMVLILVTVVVAAVSNKAKQ